MCQTTFKSVHNCVTECKTQSVITQSASYMDNTHCVGTDYEFVSKKQYGLILRQLEEWKCAYPKSISRIYGIRLVKRAIEYTKNTPNVKNPGAYCVNMCKILKAKTSQKPQADLRLVKNETDINTPNDINEPPKFVPCPPEIKEKLNLLVGKIKMS